MALPQTAVERLTKSSSQTPGAYQNMLMLGGTIFMLSLIIYFGILFGHMPYLRKELRESKAEISEFQKQFTGDEQAELELFYSQLVNLKKLLAEHITLTGPLGFLEEYTLPSVYFESANINSVNGEFSMQGIARSIEDAATQVAVFERAEGVSRVSLTNVSRELGGGVRFSVSLNLDSSLFKEIAALQ